ncbi:hypothetical protein XH88_30345 [Bradyrhizobium sp. CCBAU 51627]|nr:hypothetical protein [Bradyrhizobium sp. CCBAU 51627]
MVAGVSTSTSTDFPSRQLRPEQMIREEALNLATMFARIMRGIIEGWPLADQRALRNCHRQDGGEGDEQGVPP